jgi:hypothetical protein
MATRFLAPWAWLLFLACMLWLHASQLEGG